MRELSNGEYANKIYRQLLEDKWFCTGGKRNDDIVDYCVATVLDGLDEEVAWDQLVDWVWKTYNKLIDQHLMVRPSDYIVHELLREHFDRIMPYARVWVKRGEWKEKLLHSYDFGDE